MNARLLQLTVLRFLPSGFALVAILNLAGASAMAQEDKECKELMEKIDDVVDHIAKTGEHIGKYQQLFDSGTATEKTRKSVESMRASLQNMKATIGRLLDKLCVCCAKKSGEPSKQCRSLKEQIEHVVDHIAETGEHIGKYQQLFDSGTATEKTRKSVESMRASLQNMKATIGRLLEKFCACCAQNEGPAQQPTPSTTDKVTDVLKTIGSSVSIGIGGGGYSSGRGERHHGEDRHRTADKVSTDKTKTHTTSPTTTGHKTVTSACKCHPCTCAPCHCH